MLEHLVGEPVNLLTAKNGTQQDHSSPTPMALESEVAALREQVQQPQQLQNQQTVNISTAELFANLTWQTPIKDAIKLTASRIYRGHVNPLRSPKTSTI